MKHVISNVSSSWLIAVLCAFALALPVVPTYASLPGNNDETMIAPIGGAYVVFAGKSNGDIKKSDLIAQTEVHVEGCARGYKITAFTLEITSGNTKSTYTATSNQLTKEMKAKLQTLAKGDVLEFKLMKAMQDTGHMVDVHGNKFTVA